MSEASQRPVAPGWRAGSANFAPMSIFRQSLGVSALEIWAFRLCLLALAILILYPIGTLLFRSLQTENLAAFTFSNYRDMVATPRLVTTLYNSFFLATLTTVFSLLLGGILAWIITRTDTPGSETFSNLVLIPFLAPSFIGAFAWTILASPRTGLLNRWLADAFGIGPIFNIYTSWGIIWVMVLVEAPLVFLLVSNSFRSMDPSLEEASRIAGAGILRTTLRVTLPLAAPAFMGSALLIFVAVLGSFEVPLVLGTPANYPVLTSEIFAITNETPVRYNLAAAMCTLLLTIAATVLLIQNAILRRTNYNTVSGKSYRPERLKIGRGRYLALALLLFYFLTAVVLPIFALAMASLERFWSGSIRPEMWSFVNYEYLWNFDMMRRAAVNTLTVTLIGATVGTALAFVVGYLSFRSRVRGRSWVDFVSSISVAVPGVILALGVLITWITSPLYGTIWIILIAMVAKFLPYAQRSIVAGMVSISGELEESARLSGAGQLRTIWTIMVPLLKPSIISGWLLMFIIISRELGMSLFLFTAGTETIPVATYLLMTQRQTATAAACLLQILAVLLAVYAFRKFTNRDGLPI